ncbi:hypothetical protein Tco_0716764 [Tanacetum coccineum]
MRWTMCPSISASITRGPSVPSLAVNDGCGFSFGRNYFFPASVGLFLPPYAFTKLPRALAALTNLLLSLRFSNGVTMGAGGLNFVASAVKISLGVWVNGVNLLDTVLPRLFFESQAFEAQSSNRKWRLGLFCDFKAHGLSFWMALFEQQFPSYEVGSCPFIFLCR